MEQSLCLKVIDYSEPQILDLLSLLYKTPAGYLTLKGSSFLIYQQQLTTITTPIILHHFNQLCNQVFFLVALQRHVFRRIRITCLQALNGMGL